MNVVLGIDLGTTYSAMAYVDENGDAKIIPNGESELITPSVVFFESPDNFHVGQEAKDAVEADPDLVASFVKREIGKSKDGVRAEENYGEPLPYEFHGVTYAPEEISALVLKKLKNDAEAYFQGQVITDAVITVPAYFDDSERDATKVAGQMAGLNVLQVINEPTAAAIAYGISKEGSSSQKIFVFDLGGGTFDVTLLDVIDNDGKNEINIINSEGDHKLGGKDWDDSIIGHIATEFISHHGDDPRDDPEAMAALRISSEKIKKSLSKQEKARVALKCNGNSLKTELTRDQFESMTENLMSRIEDLCDIVLSDASLKWSEIDTILLVGGSSRMPMVRNFLTNVSGKEIRTDLVNPDQCVALGAAIMAAIIPSDPSNGESAEPVSQQFKDKLGAVSVTDVVNKTFGVVSLDQDGNEVVSQMIEKGTPTPFSYTEMFGTASDNQQNVKMEIKEGESTNPKNVKTIQEATLEIINPLPINSPIEVTFEVLADGRLVVVGRDITNNTEILVEVMRDSGMTTEEIEEGKRRLASATII